MVSSLSRFVPLGLMMLLIAGQAPIEISLFVINPRDNDEAFITQAIPPAAASFNSPINHPISIPFRRRIALIVRKILVKRMLAKARKSAPTWQASDPRVELIMNSHRTPRDDRLSFQYLVQRVARHATPQSAVFSVEHSGLTDMPPTVKDLQFVTDSVESLRGIHWRDELLKPSLAPALRDVLQFIADNVSTLPDETRLALSPTLLHKDIVVLLSILRSEGWTVRAAVEQPPIELYINDLRAELFDEKQDVEWTEKEVVIQKLMLHDNSNLHRDRHVAEHTAEVSKEVPSPWQWVIRGSAHAWPLMISLGMRNIPYMIVCLFLDHGYRETSVNQMLFLLDEWVESKSGNDLAAELADSMSSFVFDDAVILSLESLRFNISNIYQFEMRLWFWLNHESHQLDASLRDVIGRITSEWMRRHPDETAIWTQSMKEFSAAFAFLPLIDGHRVYFPHSLQSVGA